MSPTHLTVWDAVSCGLMMAIAFSLKNDVNNLISRRAGDVMVWLVWLCFISMEINFIATMMVHAK